MASDISRTLRITGLGHNIIIELPPTTTISSLKQKIATQTSIPAPYQRLLARGTKLEKVEDKTLEEVGLENRTKIMLLHSPLYIQEKDTFEKLGRIQEEINDLISKKDSGNTSSSIITELVTQICCKLDGVDPQGSQYLKSLRKELIQQAEKIDS